jgi:glycosyltransferase involved in cell wall biosynthesis
MGYWSDRPAQDAMRILLCHNYYQQRGGEDESFEAEAALLESRGHEVRRFTVHNDAVEDLSRSRASLKAFFNREVYRELSEVIVDHQPDVMHTTIIFPLLSPAAYYAARRHDVPIVQSLRNYRHLCPGVYFLRDGQVCESCLQKTIAWPAVVHGCYRDSRAASAVSALTFGLHRALGTWSKCVDYYFTLTEFAREKFIAAGWPADRIAVKPNFVYPDPKPGSGAGRYAVFVGRLSPEKGIGTLLDAWQQLPEPIPLKVIGQGAEESRLREFAKRHPHVELLDFRPLPEVLDLVGEAAFLVMPSLWYETFGRTIVEAYAKQTPVVASRHGAIAELVDDGVTGMLFEPGNAGELAAKAMELWRHPNLPGIRRAAREAFERRYQADANYQQLVQIYRTAILRHGARRAAPAAAAVASSR